jgi:hypothetical protein
MDLGHPLDTSESLRWKCGVSRGKADVRCLGPQKEEKDLIGPHLQKKMAQDQSRRANRYNSRIQYT